ncbi:MAG: flavin-containing monooxygenase, partial [Halioglobus sp.]
RWYCFSFALKPDWKHRYSYGPEIQAYMEQVAEDFGVTRRVRFNTPVADLSYDAPVWRLTTDSGEQHEYDVVITATGILHQPVYPDIEGLDDFQGERFHSARWDHDVDLAGKRVGIIGTGSTACQIVGAITPQVKQMTVFQRTPHWLAPLPQVEYSELRSKLYRKFPLLQKYSYYYYFYLLVWLFSSATVGNKLTQRFLSWVCRRHLEKQVPDPELRKHLTPDYQATCKRLIFCSDYYPALCSDNSTLVTDGIERIEANGVRTADGQLHELDVLVLATGFNAAAFMLPTKVTGENGVDLEQRWDGSPRAHRAVAIPGFPNFWMLEGPTGPVGNLSLITISEHQVDYVISMLDRMKADGLSAIAAREAAYEDYNHAMGEAIGNTTWATGGCDSWYFDKSGKPNLYPWIPTRYLKEMHNPDFSEYELVP